eukprot:145096-Prorocentrum_minimum.AAC.1
MPDVCHDDRRGCIGEVVRSHHARLAVLPVENPRTRAYKAPVVRSIQHGCCKISEQSQSKPASTCDDTPSREAATPRR